MTAPIDRSKIRHRLGHLINKRLIDITEADEEDLQEGKDLFIQLMFEDGNTLRFFIADHEAYAGGFPICFSDPYPKPDDDDGLWHPTPEEQNAGVWAVVEQRTDKGTVSHVLPTSEPLHALDEDCWCGPQRTEDGDVIHHLSE